ncbi:MAG: hypothetical protein ACK5NT_07720 [Pyrinomonadaceae bacterium]
MEDYQNLKLAYSIIQSLLKANESLNDLLAILAHTLDKETVEALTLTKEWESYMEAKRELERAQVQIEEFTNELNSIEIAIEEG